jgi:2-dehydropantoate 2-reductase
MSWKSLTTPAWAQDGWTLADDEQPYVLGAGAIGMAVACALATGGRTPVVISGWDEHLKRMNSEGICLTDSDGNETVHRVEAIDEAEFASRRGVRLCYLAVKSQATAHNAELLARSLAEDGSVVSLQNGLNETLLIDSLGSERVVGGVAPIAAQRTGPGAVTVSGPLRNFVIGELNGDDTDRIRGIAALSSHGEWSTTVVDTIEGTLWSKLLNNTRINSLCALSGLAVGPTMADPWFRAVGVEMVKEVAAVTDTLDIELVAMSTMDNPTLLAAARNDPAEADRMLRQHAERFAYVKPSTLQDVEAGRPSEIGDLSGAVVRAAHGIGIEVRTIELVTNAVLEIERRGADARPDVIVSLQSVLLPDMVAE